jgi:hypothetical protein
MLPTGRASESGSPGPGLQGLWALGDACALVTSCAKDALAHYTTLTGVADLVGMLIQFSGH